MINYLNTILKAVPVGIATYRANGETLSANDTMARLLGGTVDDIVQRNFNDLESWKRSGLREMALRALTTGEKQQGSLRHLSTYGVDVCLDCIFVPFIHAGEQQLMLMLSDVTDRRRTEDELRKSEELFRSFVENVNDIVFRLSPEGVLKYVSPHWKDAFGYELEETVGRSFVPFVHPDDVANCTVFLQLVLETGEKQSGLEYRVLHKNGAWIWYSANGSLLNDPENGEVTFLGIGRDISERKRAEEMLQKKNIEIEQLIYTVSHDLRSPLVTVKTFTSYLEKDLAEGNFDQLAEDLQFIHGAADKMKLMLDELLEMSRIDHVESPPATMSLIDVLTEALSAHAGVINERKVGIHLHETDVILFGDYSRLCQVWQNLIDNAIKYSTDDSPPIIELGVQQKNGEIVFFVKDNGIGVDPRFSNKIFGVFEKLNSKSPGAGLGLAMIQRIVQKYDGRIWVESDGVGKGSCFCFTLPNAVVQAKIEE